MSNKTMKIRCGDANPNGNVWMEFKGGCGEMVELKDAYRCTGCGGFFHLDCIFEHFELEEGHDDSRNALRKIQEIIEKARTRSGGGKPIAIIRKIQSEVKRGLNRKPENRRVKI